jgi:pseudouridine synthase
VQIRLNKVLSQAGVASRRLADQLIAQGRVEVNGHVVAELGAKADPTRDFIKVDGRRLKFDDKKQYYLLYKPTGVVTTRSDPQHRETVIDLLTKLGVKGYFYPVGRLDYDSEGLLLLTNDGDFAEAVTHPRHQLQRAYEVRVLGVPDDHELERLRKGVVIDGHRTLDASVSLRKVMKGPRGPEALVEIVITEGRNRQVRKMCDAIGHPVINLKRTRIGSLTIGTLRPGQARNVGPEEIKALTRRVGALPPRREGGTSAGGAVVSRPVARFLSGPNASSATPRAASRPRNESASRPPKPTRRPRRSRGK